MGIHFSRYDVAQAYMAVGGIPYYLNYFNKELSLPQNIDALFFSNNAPLKEEFDRMFSSLFNNADAMKLIIKAINSKNKGVSRAELTKITGFTDSGNLSKQLNALISGDFIIKYNSYGTSKRSEFYKLTDPFCIFYLTFINSNKSKKVDWINLADTQKVSIWKGYAFENLCWNHLPQIKSALQIGGVSTTESLWSKKGNDTSRGTQIDLIIERKDNVINMCEVKFYNDEFEVNKDYHLVLERRRSLLREIIPKRATIHNTLITTYGLKKSNYYSDFVQVISLDQLFTP